MWKRFLCAIVAVSLIISSGVISADELTELDAMDDEVLFEGEEEYVEEFAEEPADGFEEELLEETEFFVEEAEELYSVPEEEEEYVSLAGDTLSGTLQNNPNITWTQVGTTVMFSGTGKMESGFFGFSTGQDFDTVVIGNGVTEIAAGFFSGNFNLRNVSLGTGLKTIGNQAFSSTGLKELLVPNNVKSIGESAFEFCEQLEMVVLGSGLTYVGSEAFAYCKSLKKVTIREGATAGISIGMLADTESVQTLVIPSTVKSIVMNFLDVHYVREVDEDYPYLPLTDIYYGGTSEQWYEITAVDFDAYGDLLKTMTEAMNEDGFLKGVNIHFNSGDPEEQTTPTDPVETPVEHEDIILDAYSVPNETYRGIYLTWNAAGAASYTIYRSSLDGVGMPVSSVLLTIEASSGMYYDADHKVYEWTDTSPIDNKKYDYWVVAVDQNNKSWNSNTVSCGITGRVANLNAKNVRIGRSVQLTWSAARNAVRYELYRVPAFSSGAKVSIDANNGFYSDKNGNVNTQTCYHDIDIDENTTYTYWMVLYGEGGAGEASDKVTITTPKLNYHVPDDTWGFNNVKSIRNARYYLSTLHKNLIYSGLNEAAIGFVNYHLRDYSGGVCLGHSISSVLQGADMLPAAMKLPAEYSTLYEVPDNEWAESLLVYYQTYVLSDEYWDDVTAYEKLSTKEQLQGIANADLPVVIVYSYTTDTGIDICHAIVGYELQSIPVAFEYNQRLAIYDNEHHLDKNGEPNEWLYLNTSTGKWQYQDADSDEGAKLNYVCNDYSRMRGYDLSHLNYKDNRKKRIITPVDVIEEQFLQVIKKNNPQVDIEGELAIPGGKTLIDLDTDDDLVFENLSEGIGILDGESFQSLTVPSCESVRFGADGSVSASGLSDDYSLEIISDALGSGVGSFSASGKACSSFSVQPSDSGLLISGDDLKDVTIGLAGDGIKEISFSPKTEKSDILVKTDNGILSVRIDNDGDGTFDKSIYDEKLTDTAGGQVDNGITWKLEGTTLLIEGKGAIPEYSSFTETPWYAVRNDIQEVMIGEGITRIGSYAFHSRKSLLRTGDDPKGADSLLKVTFPSTLQSIGDYAFTNCNHLTELNIPDTMAGPIGNEAFYRCEMLKSLHIGEKTTYIGHGAFGACGQLQEVVIPASVAKIEDGWKQLEDYRTSYGAFERCYSLKSVKYMSNADVADAMFVECKALTNIEWIGKPVRIGKCAFELCGLEKAVIPESIYQLDEGAYMDNRNLKAIYFEGDAPGYLGSLEYGGGAFYEVTADAYYPEGNGTWTKKVMDIYDPSQHAVQQKTGEYDKNCGKLTWIAYKGDEPGSQTEEPGKTDEPGGQTDEPGKPTEAPGGQTDNLDQHEEDGSADSPKDIKAATVIGLADAIYTGLPFTRNPTVIVGDRVLKCGNDYDLTYADNINAGTALVVITGKGNYTGSQIASFTIHKAPQNFTVSTKIPAVKASKVATKKRNINTAKTFSISNAHGTISYRKISGSNKLSIGAGGRITVKKGTKKGIYKMQVRVTATGNENYEEGRKVVTVKVCVK